MQRKEVTDLYEAAWLVLEGGRIEEVACIPLGSRLACKFTLAGEDLNQAQEKFHAKQAVANLNEFRSAYSQVNSFMAEAKKSWERGRRELLREGRI
jgi:hypothetical protein